MIRILPALALLAATGTHARFEPRVIYGEDNRRELHQVTDARVRNLARSSGALVATRDLKDLGPSSYYLQGKSLREEYNLCPSEPFLEQPSTSFCSGVLVAEDLFLTAGHCFDSAKSCESTLIVFDYALPRTDANPRLIQKANVFQCKKILVHANSETADYALLVLEKPVHGRMPVPFRRSGKIPIGAPLFMIGHPSGLPQKVAENAKVIGYDKIGFNADLDAFAANSGSPVFNALTFELEGLLIEGEDDDYVKHPANQCDIQHRCNPEDDCMGESSAPINEVIRRAVEDWSER